MLRRFKEMSHYKVHASDGEMGHLEDLYFQENGWMIRYFVINTGGWLAGRSVLMAPHAFRSIDDRTKGLVVDLTREQVRSSPPAEADQPLSRAYEQELHEHYGWPLYWGDGQIITPGAAGIPPVPMPAVETTAGNAPFNESAPGENPEDPYLRSAHDLMGDRISALDGEIGHVDDVVVDDALWFVRYLVVNTGKWLSGREVLLSATWITRTSWAEDRVFVNLERDVIETSPEVDLKRPLSRADEERLFQHYGQSAYW